MLKSQNFHTRADRIVPPAATGALLALSFPPYSLPFVSFIALAPLLRSWRYALDPRRMYIDAYFAFQLTFVLAFSWPLFHALPATALASLTGVLLIPMVMAAPFALAVSVRNGSGLTNGYIFLSSLYLLVEGFWLYGPLAMPGALLGHSLAAWPSLNQFADLAGVPGLSLWILVVNILITEAWIDRKIRARALGVVCLSIFVMVGYSALRRAQYDDPARESIRVLAVQPAIPAADWTSADDASRFNRLLLLTDSLLESLEDKVSLVVWPETAIPLARTDAEATTNNTRLRRWVADRKVALLAGSITRSRLPVDPEVAFANSALLYSTEGEISQYDKNILVPFAERVPLESISRGLSLLRVDAGGVAGYQPGHTQPLFEVQGAAFGVLICFESLFGHLARNYARQGASFGIVLSNIGWWGPSFAPPQYLAFTRLRAIETRRAFLIDTVTGPGALVYPNGKMIPLAGWLEEAGAELAIPLQNEITMYARFGDWLLVLALAVAAGIGALHFRKQIS